jgi:hypothetical protein
MFRCAEQEEHNSFSFNLVILAAGPVGPQLGAAKRLGVPNPQTRAAMTSYPSSPSAIARVLSVLQAGVKDRGPRRRT